MSLETRPRSASARHAPVRDSVTTISADGSRPFLYPADARGRFITARRLAAYLLIAVYLLLPWIPVNGYPALFLDVAARRFHFFGLTLSAQDAWLLFFGVSGLGFALFFLTALFGRLWCGWACPQTVFLDYVYRRIERWIEGDAPARRALQDAPMAAGKFLRRAAKHALYALVSLAITHLFLAYFVSIPELWLYMHEAPGEHWASFLFVFIAAGILYFNFAWFREQLCIVICPYGRLQSALTDDHTLVIGYDTKRGEPRGKLHGRVGPVSDWPRDRSETGPTFGACIDCHRCVQVCPTGIDIRHGLQMECIGCAACIDACDEVMVKVKRPVGLIRYDSFAGFSGGVTRWLRSRTILYAVLMFVGAAVATYAFSTVKPMNFLVYRMTGAAYFVGHAEVRNQFMVRLVNKRTVPATFTVATAGLPAGVRQTGFGAPVTLEPLGESVSPLILLITRKDYTGPFKFSVQVQDAGRAFTLAREVEFIGPDARLLREEEEEREHEGRERQEKKHD
ncbi:MAG: cytochrome c oxidase accessory protein CcoG [Lacunisphaera sp.]|nr:cytochrome c oxidase accessory protein CcoG [Lacunisphaera sp.]